MCCNFQNSIQHSISNNMWNFQGQSDTAILLGEHPQSIMGIVLEINLFCTNSYGSLGDEILSYQAHFKSKRQTSVLFLVLFDVVLFLVRFMCGLMRSNFMEELQIANPKGECQHYGWLEPLWTYREWEARGLAVNELV